LRRVPVDELLASTTIVADLQVEGGARVERRASPRARRRVAARLGPLRRFAFATKSEYALVESGSGVVLEGRADGSASGSTSASASIRRAIRLIEWRWRVLQTPAGLDPGSPRATTRRRA